MALSYGIAMKINKIVSTLLNTHQEKINKTVEGFKNNRNHLISKTNEDEIFKELIRYIYTAGFRWKTAVAKVNELENKFGKGKITPQNLSNRSIDTINSVFKNSKKNEKIIEISKYIVTQKIDTFEYVNRLYNFRKNGVGDAELKKTWIGPKSTDIFLRSVGFFDCYGIDVLLTRFIVRTGLLSEAIEKYNSNDFKIHLGYATAYEDWKRIMGKIYSECSIKWNEYDLKEFPGILDYILICNCEEKDEREDSIEDVGGVCREVPLCGRCAINNLCQMCILKNTTENPV